MLAELCIIHTKLTFNVDINQLTSYICIGSLVSICVEFVLQACSLCSFLSTEASDLSQDTKMSVSMYLEFICVDLLYMLASSPTLLFVLLPFSLSGLYWYVFEEYLHVFKLCVSLYWQILSSNILQGVYYSFSNVFILTSFLDTKMCSYLHETASLKVYK